MTAIMKIIEPIAVNDTRLTASNVTEADYTAWNSATAYVVDDYCILATTHRIYRAAVNNTDKNPPDNLYDATVDPATGYWIDVSATNAWKMFDGKSRAATSRAESIEVSIAPGQLFNSLVLLGLVAASVSITVNDPDDGEVYAAEIDLYDSSGVTGYYEWAFLPIVRKPLVVITDLPAYPNATITIVVSDPGETAQVGECIVGRQKQLGTLLNGYTVSYASYSKTGRDDYGNAILEEGEYSEPISYILRIDSAKAYDIKRTLGQLSNTPIVFIGNETALESIVYGWISDYKITRNDARTSSLTIEAEELN